MKLKRLYPVFVVTLFFVVFFCDCLRAEPVSISAQQVRYSEDRQIMYASGNVKLKYSDVEIHAPNLIVDTQKKLVWATGNIQIQRGEDRFFSSYLYMNLPENEATIKDIHIAIEPPGQKDKLYLSATSITDKPEYKSGQNGLFTSCSYAHPHYFIWAQSFTYYPDKRLIGYNVFFYNPILFIPFGLWTPIYSYELGKRRVIWNFPAIGEKKSPDGWGWFMQNTIDYDNINGKDSSLFMDFFEFRGIGWQPGYGIRHQYLLGQNHGSVYYYELKALNTGQLHVRKSWDQAWQFNSDMKGTVAYQRTEAERISGGGRQDVENSDGQFTYDHLGDYYNLKTNNRQDYNQRYQSWQFSMDHNFNSEKQYAFNYKQNDNRASREKRTDSGLTHYIYLPDEAQIKTDLAFNRYERERQAVPDDRMRATTIYSRKLSDQFQFKLTVDQLFDLDEDRVTSDVGQNNFFYRQPELSLGYSNVTLDQWAFSGEMVMGRYQEHQYDRGTNKVRKFPDESHYDAAPNTYIFKQQVNRQFADLPGQSTFDLSCNLDQYVFNTPGKSLFEGDALYRYTIAAQHQSDLFGFVKLNTNGNRGFSPKESNSPFFEYDGLRNLDINTIEEKVTLYWQQDTKYHWSHSYGYNYVLNKRYDYLTEILVNPNELFRLQMNTGKNFDEGNFYPYLPLVSDLNLQPTGSINIQYNLSQDVNFGIIRDSFCNLKYKFSEGPDFYWEFQGMFQYNMMGYEKDFRMLVLNRYEMQTYRLMRFEHCRTFEMSYNKRLEEFRFKITILAFPEDSIGFVKNKELWKVEGILDDQSDERF